jgi:hypothetical protein
MPRYYFKVIDGMTLNDPSGMDCRDDPDAVAKTKIIAHQIATQAPPVSQPRRIAILDEDGNEVSIVPVSKRPDLRPVPKKGGSGSV